MSDNSSGKKESTEQTAANQQSSKKRYYISFPGILIRCFLLSLLCACVIFLSVILLSLTSFFLRQLSLLAETETALKDTLDAAAYVSDGILSYYEEDLRFMNYAYQELKTLYPEAEDQDLYSRLMNLFPGHNAAVISPRGEILASTASFQLSDLSEKLQRLKPGQIGMIEQTPDTGSAVYQRLNDHAYGIFQFEENDETAQSVLSSMYSMDVLVLNKSTEEDSVILLDSDNSILFAPDPEMIGQTFSYFGDNIKTNTDIPGFQISFTNKDSPYQPLILLNRETGTWYIAFQQNEKVNGMTVCVVSNISPALQRIQNYALILSAILFAILLVQSAYVYYNRQYRDLGVRSVSYSPNAVRYKTAVVTILGIIAAAGLTYYSNTMYSLSNFILNTDAIIRDLSDFRHFSEYLSDGIEKAFSEKNLRRAFSISSFLGTFPQYETRQALQSIADVYQADYLVLYDMEGHETLANNTYSDLSLTEPFSDLVFGVPYVIGDSAYDDWQGRNIQPVGVLILDQDQNPSGILKAGFNTQISEKLIRLSAMDKIINQIIASGNTSIIVIDADTQKVFYAPNSSLAGVNAVDAGFKESQLKSGYTGEISLEGERYYVTSRQFENYLIYGGVASSSVFVGRFLLTVIATLLSFLNFQLILFHMRGRRKNYDAVVYAGRNEKILLPLNLKYEYYNPELTKKAFDLESTANQRFFSLKQIIRRWRMKVPEEKVLSLVKCLLFIGGFILLHSYMNRSAVYSIINYSLDSSRGAGFNVYALTSILVIVIIGLILLNIVLAVLDLTAQLMRPRGETICRLVKSTIELFSVLAIFYICLSRLGFDIGVLVAGAGLMGLVISMGAQDLITDILAGLFIIFEGDFQVGDIIDTGNFTGMVSEIGIRTTKIVSWDGNIRIENNRKLSNIVNLSRNNSYAIVVFRVPGTTDTEVLEQAINSGLAHARDTYPQLLGNPYFKGVHNISGGLLECRVVAEVAERYRDEIEEKLNEEIQAILKANSIPLS